MKKLLSVLLALVMVLGLATTAFAAEPPETTPGLENGAFKKNYMERNAGSGSPAETFTFTVTPLYRDATNTTYYCKSFDSGYVIDGTTATSDGVIHCAAPAITIEDLPYSAGEAGDATNAVKPISVNMPSVTAWPTIGVYFYKIVETAGGTPGVEYDCTAAGAPQTNVTHYLKVSVTYNDNHTAKQVAASFVSTTPNGSDASGNTEKTKKDDTIYNIYKATGTGNDPGTFTVRKIVTGEMGDDGYAFPIDVTFEIAGTQDKKPKQVQYQYNADGTNNNFPDWTFADNKWTATDTIKLKDDNSAIFIDVPYGASYTVREKTGVGQKVTDDGYTISYDCAGGGDDDLETGTQNDAQDNGTDNSATGPIGDGKRVVTVTNSRDANIDTGVVLDNLPYVVLLAVVAAGLFLLLNRKRRTGED